MGIPISFMFMQSVKHFVLAFGGEIWPSRLIGFGIGVIIFTIMSELLFKEPFTLKTGICLFLGTLIILVQLFWK
jgi:multidrug transporter EmrE-like cation transporter